MTLADELVFAEILEIDRADRNHAGRDRAGGLSSRPRDDAGRPAEVR